MKKEGIVASLFWTANIVLVKLFLNQFDANVLALYKALLSSLMLFVVMNKEFQMTKKEILILLGTGFLTVFLNYFFSYQAMKEVSLAEVSLVNALTLALVRPKLDCFNYLIALAFLIGTYGSVNGYLLLSMTSYVLGIYLSRKSQLDELTRTTFTLFFGSLFFLPQAKLIDFTLVQWLLFLSISVLGYGYIMYVYLKSSKANPFLNLHPIFTYLIGLFFFNEPFYWHHLLAFFLVLLALIFSTKKTIKN